MAMGDVEVDYTKLCSELESQEQEVFLFVAHRYFIFASLLHDCSRLPVLELVLEHR